MAAPRVVRYGIEDQTFLLVQGHNTNPLQSVREAVVNGADAGATRVVVTTLSDKTRVGDDGCGMTKADMPRLLKNLGAGAKARGRLDHFGIGIKMGALIAGCPIDILSCPKRLRGQGVGQLLRLDRDDNGQYGVVVWNDDDLTKDKDMPARGDESTIVEIYRQFPAVDIIQFLNRRFLTVDCDLTVVDRVNGSGVQKCEGLLKALETIALRKAGRTYCGQKDYKTCTLYWAIRADRTPEIQAFEEQTCRVPPLSLAAFGECYFNWEPMHAHLLNQWGIRAATSDIVLVVEAKGPNLSPNMFRDGVTGWDLELAKEEVRQDLPVEIRDYDEVFEAQHFEDPGTEADMVADLLDVICRNLGAPPQRSRAARTPNANGTSAGKPAGPRSRTAPQIHRPPRPSYVFVDKKVLGFRPVQYDQVEHRVLINKDSEAIARILQGARNAEERRDLRVAIAVQVIEAFVTAYRLRGELPDTDLLEGAVFGNFGAWLLRNMPLHRKRLKTRIAESRRQLQKQTS
jgi:hypothetical protein